MSYAVIKYFYQIGVWKKAYVANAVKMKVITVKQYKEITGEEYQA